MALNQLFRVGTEFRFEVGSAFLGMKGLTEQVERLSGAADNALIGFKRLGVGIAANLGLGGGGALGFLSQAVQASEKFTNAQIKMSNILVSNRENLIGPLDDFNSRMQISETLLKSLSREAAKFSLDEGQFLQTFQLLSAQLIPKGLAGNNLVNAKDLSRNFLKSSPFLGINPEDAQGQLQDLLGGRANQGRLFQRLAAETKALQEFGKSGSTAFVKLPAPERVKRLSEALNQFASSFAEIDARTRTLGGSMTRLKNTFSGLDGAIIPIGQVIIPGLVQQIARFTDILDTNLRVVFSNLAKIIKPLASDLDGLIVTLLQLKNVTNDLKLASKGLGLIGIITLVSHFFSLTKILSFLGVNIGRLIGFVTPFIFNMKVLGVVFKLLGFAVRTFFAPMLALFTLFQVISRAMAIAKVRDVLALPEILEKFSALSVRFKNAISNIALPFRQIIDYLAERIAFLFQKSFLLQQVFPILDDLVSVLESIGKAVVLATAGLNGLFFAIFQIVDNLLSGNIANLTKGVGDAFNAGVQGVIENNLSSLGLEGEGAIRQSITNISKVEITNSFKDNLEPDRIAFSLKEQLLKAAQNPTQAKGRNFSRASALGGG